MGRGGSGVGERGLWSGETSLSDGPTGLQLSQDQSKKFKSTSWCQGAVRTIDERTCDREVPELLEGSPNGSVRLTSLSACLGLKRNAALNRQCCVAASSSGRRWPRDPAAGTGVDVGLGGAHSARLMGAGWRCWSCGRPSSGSSSLCVCVRSPLLLEWP